MQLIGGLFNKENWVGELPRGVKAAIRERRRRIELQPGQACRMAGQMPEGIYRILEGQVRLKGLREDGNEMLIAIYSKGNSFAETAVVSRRPLHHSTIALTPTIIEYLPTGDFWELFEQHRQIPVALCRKFSDSIGRQLGHRELHLSRTLLQRLATIFVNAAEVVGRTGEGRRIIIESPLTQQDFADHLGMTRQSVQREVKSLKEAGCIERVDGQWQVIDMLKLGQLSAGI